MPQNVITGIRFIGRSGGAVKTLDGFKKSHHTLPDAVNAATSAFLGRVCTGELEAAAEGLFQTARTVLGYKRKELSLTVASPSAVLTAREFTFEISYALDEADPGEFALTRTLLDVQDADFIRDSNFNTVFSGMFTELSFRLRKAARVEDVIDAVEALDGADNSLWVDYPSDCRECAIRVEGVDAVARCTGASLDLVFPRAGSPVELLDAFASVRHAFGVSKVLATLVA